MRVFLVRHAEAAPGEPDALRPLTADGSFGRRTRARRGAWRPSSLDAVVSSPLRRARETAEPIARAAGLDACGRRRARAGRDRGDAARRCRRARRDGGRGRAPARLRETSSRSSPGERRPFAAGRRLRCSSCERGRRPRPAQVVRRPRGAPRNRLHDRGGRGVRPARPERRRQDDDRRDPRGLPQA